MISETADTSPAGADAPKEEADAPDAKVPPEVPSEDPTNSSLAPAVELKPEEDETKDAARPTVDDGEEKAAPVPMEVESGDKTSIVPVKKEGGKQVERSRKRARSPDVSGGQASNSVSAASAAAAAQLAATMGWNGIYSLLIARPSGSSSASGASGSASLQISMMLASSTASAAASSAISSTNNLPTVQQVQQAVTKYLSDIPPFVHLSKADSAPQLKLSGLPGGNDDRLTVKGGMRGYRMSRATHGVSAGNYYYEVIILPPPKASEIVAMLPPNARLGRALQAQVQAALRQEKEDEEKGEVVNEASSTAPSKKKEAASKSRSVFGGHLRLGWSMRTGDLQAPVGYDKWSFGIRDIGGSKIHCSRRDDYWGGEDFGPGDIVGCAISLYDPKKDVANSSIGMGSSAGYGGGADNETKEHDNHIRFFKNGQPMGQFVISKGKREGGMAFQIPSGVYYPAISLYMGASCRVNFGPHFVCPPKKLPSALRGIKPVSDLCPAPMPVKDAVAKVQKEKTFRKPDKLQAFQELVQTEVQMLHDAYNEHYKTHLQEVRQERESRNLSTSDLENIEVPSSAAESK